MGGGLIIILYFNLFVKSSSLSILVVIADYTVPHTNCQYSEITVPRINLQFIHQSITIQFVCLQTLTGVKRNDLHGQLKFINKDIVMLLVNILKELQL